jgi:hypothetical protein
MKHRFAHPEGALFRSGQMIAGVGVVAPGGQCTGFLYPVALPTGANDAVLSETLRVEGWSGIS